MQSEENNLLRFDVDETNPQLEYFKVDGRKVCHQKDEAKGYFGCYLHCLIGKTAIPAKGKHSFKIRGTKMTEKCFIFGVGPSGLKTEKEHRWGFAGYSNEGYFYNGAAFLNTRYTNVKNNQQWTMTVDMDEWTLSWSADGIELATVGAKQQLEGRQLYPAIYMAFHDCVELIP